MTERKRYASQTRAINKYISKAYDRINLLAEPGTKERIKAAAAPGESVNGFINAAIRAELEHRNAERLEEAQEVQPLI